MITFCFQVHGELFINEHCFGRQEKEETKISFDVVQAASDSKAADGQNHCEINSDVRTPEAAVENLSKLRHCDNRHYSIVCEKTNRANKLNNTISCSVIAKNVCVGKHSATPGDIASRKSVSSNKSFLPDIRTDTKSSVVQGPVIDSQILSNNSVASHKSEILNRTTFTNGIPSHTNVQDEGDNQSFGSPGTPLMDEQPYSPCLIATSDSFNKDALCLRTKDELSRKSEQINRNESNTFSEFSGSCTIVKESISIDDNSVPISKEDLNFSCLQISSKTNESTIGCNMSSDIKTKNSTMCSDKQISAIKHQIVEGDTEMSVKEEKSLSEMKIPIALLENKTAISVDEFEDSYSPPEYKSKSQMHYNASKDTSGKTNNKETNNCDHVHPRLSKFPKDKKSLTEVKAKMNSLFEKENELAFTTTDQENQTTQSQIDTSNSIQNKLEDSLLLPLEMSHNSLSTCQSSENGKLDLNTANKIINQQLVNSEATGFSNTSLFQIKSEKNFHLNSGEPSSFIDNSLCDKGESSWSNCSIENVCDDRVNENSHDLFCESDKLLENNSTNEINLCSDNVILEKPQNIMEPEIKRASNQDGCFPVNESDIDIPCSERAISTSWNVSGYELSEIKFGSKVFPRNCSLEVANIANKVISNAEVSPSESQCCYDLETNEAGFPKVVSKSVSNTVSTPLSDIQETVNNGSTLMLTNDKNSDINFDNESKLDVIDHKTAQNNIENLLHVENLASLVNHNRSPNVLKTPQTLAEVCTKIHDELPQINNKSECDIDQVVNLSNNCATKLCPHDLTASSSINTLSNSRMMDTISAIEPENTVTCSASITVATNLGLTDSACVSFSSSPQGCIGTYTSSESTVTNSITTPLISVSIDQTNGCLPSNQIFKRAVAISNINVTQATYSTIPHSSVSDVPLISPATTTSSVTIHTAISSSIPVTTSSLATPLVSTKAADTSTPLCASNLKMIEGNQIITSQEKDSHQSRHTSSSNRRRSSSHKSDDHRDKHRRSSESKRTDTESSSKEGDRKHSSSTKKYHCLRCYNRSKIKRASIGVQCRRDKTVDKYIRNESIDTVISSGPKLDFQTKHYSLPRPFPISLTGVENLKYGRFIRIETYPNGGASVVHMYQDEIDCLNKTEMDELAKEFFKVSVQLCQITF